MRLSTHSIAARAAARKGSSRVPAVLVAIIIAENIAWAGGCIALLVTGFASPSGLGAGFVVLQTVAVVIFAGLEYRGLRASEPEARACAAAER